MYMRFMIIPIAFLMVVLAVQDAHAESPRLEPGAKAGLNFSKWSRTSVTPSILDRTYKHGFTGGIHLHLPWWPHISPQAEILFTSRGSAGEIEGRRQGVFNLHYVDAVLLARAELPIRPVILFAVAGPAANVLIKSTHTNPDGMSSESTGLRRFDVGVVAGAGVTFGWFSWGTLTIETRYAMGFIDVAKELEDVSLTNRTISLMLGYEYRRARDRAAASK
jgi:hypothetical protein